MSPIWLPLLVLIAECYCAPGSLIDIGGDFGYESVMNGTIGGDLKAQRDGLSVNGTAKGIIGASWAPTLIARGHAQVGERAIAGDASLKTNIDNSWQPGFEGAIGRNSNGTWLLGGRPESVLKNKFLLTPVLKVKTGDEARKMAGLPLAPVSEEQKVLPQQAQMPGAPGPYAPYPYGFNPNAVSGINSYMPNPQWQMPQPQYGQPQYGQPQYGQPQYGQPQYLQPQYGQPQYGQPQYLQPQYGQPQYAQPQYGQPQYAQVIDQSQSPVLQNEQPLQQ